MEVEEESKGRGEEESGSKEPIHPYPSDIKSEIKSRSSKQHDGNLP